MDIGLNSDFDIELDGRNDLPLVTGRGQFEQNFALRLTAYFDDNIGSIDQPTVIERLRVAARRIVDDMAGLERVVNIRIRYDDKHPNTVLVTAIYDTGDEFTFSLSE